MKRIPTLKPVTDLWFLKEDATYPTGAIARGYPTAANVCMIRKRTKL